MRWNKMRKKLVMILLLSSQIINYNASQLDVKQNLAIYNDLFTNWQVIDKVKETIGELEGTNNKTLKLTDDIYLKSVADDEQQSSIIQEYDNQELRAEALYNQQQTVIKSYNDDGLEQVQTFNHGDIIKNQQYDKNGIITHQYEYTDYSVIETKYEDGMIYFLEEVSDGVVIRDNQYLEGKIVTETLYSKDGDVTAITTYDQNEVVLLHQVFDRNQVLSAKTQYQNGVISRVYNYYDDGVTSRSITNYNEGIKSTSYDYNPEGLLTNKQTYFEVGDGVGLIYLEHKYDPNGVIREDLRYDSSGELNRQRLYSEMGIIEHHYIYNNKHLKSEYLYDQAGNPTEFISYYPDNSIKSTIEYMDGIKQNRSVFTENGVLQKYSVYKPDGSGFISTETYFTEGKTKGEIKTIEDYYSDVDVLQKKQEFNQNGTRKFTYSYNKNKTYKQRYDYHHGALTTKSTYNNTGVKQATYYYENNQLVRKIDYNPDSSYKLNYYIQEKLIRTDYYNSKNERYRVVSHLKTEKLKGYQTKTASICDMGRTRERNVVVDIGVDSDYAKRDYYAYTNDYGQLVQVDAAQIIRQNETYEDVVWGRSGIGKELRYCKSEAQVPGSEPAKYDKGHVIADSMGGAANAYNITPQIEEINVSGAQAQMENMFRVAFAQKKTVTDFRMTITYKNNQTNVPSKYAVTFKIDGQKYDYSKINQ